ncbi:hypothetical protein YC2023_081917 [Brassica napus]
MAALHERMHKYEHTYNFSKLKNPHARHNNVTINLDDKLVQGKILRYHFLQPPGRTQVSESPIKERSRSPLKGTLGPVPGTDLPSKKWKISDKENLSYFRIWNSLA